MTANIYWLPINTANDLSVGAPSSFIASLEAVFGSLPLTLGSQHYDRLMAMAAASAGDQKRAYKMLADACVENDIRVWAEY